MGEIRAEPSCNGRSEPWKRPAIPITAEPYLLREFLNGSVDREFRGHVRLFGSPLKGLIHYGPPHLSYTGLVERTATKS